MKLRQREAPARIAAVQRQQRSVVPRSDGVQQVMVASVIHDACHTGPVRFSP